MELPRTNTTVFSASVYRSANGKVNLTIKNAFSGNRCGIALDAREIDDLCVMLQYAKKVVIEEGGELD